MEMKDAERAAFWKQRVEETRAAFDRWRECPMSNCLRRGYKYQSRSTLERHLRIAHKAR